jgi:ankyrin repeat protein
VAELLIAHGAEVNAQNEKGVTPLKAAIDAMQVNPDRKRLEAFADLLRQHGAKE